MVVADLGDADGEVTLRRVGTGKSFDGWACI